MNQSYIGKRPERDNGASAIQLQKMLRISGARMITPVKFISRVSREHNYYTIRLKTESFLPQIDGIIALAKANEKLFRNKLRANGFILGDRKLPLNDPRVLRLITEQREMDEHSRKDTLCGGESSALNAN